MKNTVLDLFDVQAYDVATMKHLNDSRQESKKKKFAVHDSDTPVTLKQGKVINLIGTGRPKNNICKEQCPRKSHC